MEERWRQTAFTDGAVTSMPRASVSVIPYRSREKLADLYADGAPFDRLVKVHRIPRWEYKKQKKYEFSHVHGYNAYMLDVMFFRRDGSPIWFNPYETGDNRERLLQARKAIPFLLLIHCNSRFGWIKPMRDHTSTSIADTLLQIFDESSVQKPITFISDAAPDIARAIHLLPFESKHIAINM